MQIEILHQFPGGKKLNNQIKEALIDREYTRLRILVAYISWQGIRLIHKELENFYDDGKPISIILGIGDGNTESDAIMYLMQRFPRAQVFLFHIPVKYFKFHPKMYIFSDKSKMLVFIGSNNFTTGGLYFNSECCVKLSLEIKSDKKICQEVENIWKCYSKPSKFFKPRNLHRMDIKLLEAYSSAIQSIPIPKDRQTSETKNFNKIFPFIPIERPVLPTEKPKKDVKKEKVGDTLLLEILKETGAGGTQVQIPRKVIDDYFTVPVTGRQTIELKFKGKEIRPAVICHFDNNTHRISFPELAGVERPLLMRFGKLEENVYAVELIKGIKYRRLITLCTNQTRSAARKWEILDT